MHASSWGGDRGSVVVKDCEGVGVGGVGGEEGKKRKNKDCVGVGGKGVKSCFSVWI
jgi:hypothetical protein